MSVAALSPAPKFRELTNAGAPLNGFIAPTVFEML